MRISERLAAKQTFSFEIFPPKGDLPIDQALAVAGALAADKPDWISVTFSAGGSGNSANTLAVAGELLKRTAIEPLAHLTCMGSERADIDAYLASLGAAGISNVLALRGDRIPGREVADFAYASNLISYIKHAAPEFCIGAACYPEGHVECEDFELSMRHLYAKQQAGADFLVTQLFFDNELFYTFREACTRHRIKIPIVAGIMPFTSAKQIQRMAFTCGATIPATVIKRIVSAGDDPADQAKAGLEYALEQIVDLAANGVDGIHIYTMNRHEIGDAAYDALLACGYLKD